MNDNQLLRYSRHILMSEVDVAGQEKLLNSHVLIIGAGGLGSPVATYLAASGVGTLTICDFDEVELSNLQRQPIHNEARIGINKALSAREDLNRINPDCRVHAITERVDEQSIEALISQADVVVDACDNFKTRHLINRAAYRSKTPLVSGAAIHLTGQLSVYRFADNTSPCYACLVAESTEVPEQRCATMGVLSPVTGTIGTLQATEVIKLIVKGESQLEGTLLLYDAMSVEFHRVPLSKNPSCTVCG
ncbi:MAG: HesA/MoeB/ThiF family protein [Oceanospirillaceae bacterium]|nr:HesA/MoeB/ThiF family protein [Oceanospirillaceae bacterium]